MKLVIVSGRSGSGKSTALHVLEDLGFYCIDNLPVGLLLELGKQAFNGNDNRLENIAVSIDARNLQNGIDTFPAFYEALQHEMVQIDIIYLDAHSDTLLKRFHATRRKHPLSDSSRSLTEAIESEKELLVPLSTKADLVIDTTHLSLYELRDLIKIRVSGRKSQELALLFQSFGFKHGVPSDADYVFDVRCLPNPYWDPKLRSYTGMDQPIIDFLKNQEDTQEMKKDVIAYLEKWLPKFQNSNRSYMTVAIGCTGGQHRSVYICQELGNYFRQHFENIQIRHKELSGIEKKHLD